MNNTAPMWMGLAALAGLFFVLATGVAFVIYDFPVVSAVFVGVIVAAVGTVALALGWTPPRAAAPAPAATAAPAAAAHVAAAAPVPVAAPAVAPVAVTGMPVFLSAPDAGGPDDLKLIKGVGPKLETTLHDMGIYHFHQIASWGAAEQTWMDDNLEGFKGRATRDEWVPQARVLARGAT